MLPDILPSDNDQSELSFNELGFLKTLRTLVVLNFYHLSDGFYK